MNSRALCLALGLVLSTAVVSCGKKSEPTGPPPQPEPDPGDIEVFSWPSGASIFLDGTATGRTTPDTLRQVSFGTHVVGLKLANHADTSASVQVSSPYAAQVNLNLRYVQTYSPPSIAFVRRTVEIYEILGPPAAADFDRDGMVDLISGGRVSNRSHIRLLQGQGDGTFVLSTMIVDTTAEYWSRAVGDFNRDGNSDIAVLFKSAFESDLAIYLGNGDGTFRRGSTVHGSLYPLGAVASQLHVADVSGDGTADLLIGYNAGAQDLAVGIWIGNGDGTVRPLVERTHRFSSRIHRATAIAVADFTQDGVSDVAESLSGTESSSGMIVLWKGVGGGALSGSPTSLPVNGVTVDVGFGDFNRDGKQDLVAVNSGGGTGLGIATVLLARGAGAFETAFPYRTGTSSARVVVADFNADGRQDLAVVDLDSASLSALAGLGDGVFQAALMIATSPSRSTGSSSRGRPGVSSCLHRSPEVREPTGADGGEPEALGAIPEGTASYVALSRGCPRMGGLFYAFDGRDAEQIAG